MIKCPAACSLISFKKKSHLTMISQIYSYIRVAGHRICFRPFWLIHFPFKINLHSRRNLRRRDKIANRPRFYVSVLFPARRKQGAECQYRPAADYNHLNINSKCSPLRKAPTLFGLCNSIFLPIAYKAKGSHSPQSSSISLHNRPANSTPGCHKAKPASQRVGDQLPTC